MAVELYDLAFVQQQVAVVGYDVAVMMNVQSIKINHVISLTIITSSAPFLDVDCGGGGGGGMRCACGGGGMRCTGGGGGMLCTGGGDAHNASGGERCTVGGSVNYFSVISR